jgi:N-acyl-D-aspartate/D-glutamate deacylase
MSGTKSRICVLLFGIACSVGDSMAASQTYDLIVRQGTVIDGSGAPRRSADVGVIGGRIAKVGDLSADRATEEIDAKGLFVVPGFINIHSHATTEGLASAENMLTQGVTTEILNADGSGLADVAQQFSKLQQSRLAINAGYYLGFNSVWTAVVGEADRRPTAQDVARMRELIETGLEAGAWGVASGLDYKPAYYATEKEVISVVEAARAWRTNFPNHDRLTPETGLSSKAGVAETLRIGAASGLVPVVTHVKAQGHENGMSRETTQMMRQMSLAGHYAAGDVYPYTAGMTLLRAFFIPGWAQEGGREKMLKRFADPALRARIASEGEAAMAARIVGGPKGIYVIDKERKLSDIAADLNVSAGNAVIQLIEEADVGMIAEFGIESDLIEFLRYPDMAVACDCGAITEAARHPRENGTFPRVLGKYVREQKVLTWEDAIRKMTALPANIVGMVDRGFLAAGMAADIAVLDPEKVIDRATYANPRLQSEGIRYVVVNGRVTLAAGKPTGATAGAVVRHAIDMPSRPMNGTASPRFVAKANFPAAPPAFSKPFSIDIDVTQLPGASARGDLRIVGVAPDDLVSSVELGVLQSAGGWSSVTAQARMKSGKSLPVVITAEQGDGGGKGASTLTVRINGGPPVTAAIVAKSLTLGAARPQ